MSVNSVTVHQSLDLVGQASAPVSPTNGNVYYDSTLNLFQFYQNGSYTALGGLAANKALSNLTTTSINLSLLPGVTNSIDLGSASKIWLNVHTTDLVLYGATSGNITQQATAITTNYSVKWPAVQGGAGSQLTNDGTGNLTWVVNSNAAIPEFNAGNSGTALTINFNNSPAQKTTLTGNCTFTFSNPINGSTYILKLIQDATGSRTVTWPAAVLWGASAPILSTTPAKRDIISLYYDGTNYFGTYSLGY